MKIYTFGIGAVVLGGKVDKDSGIGVLVAREEILPHGPSGSVVNNTITLNDSDLVLRFLNLTGIDTLIKQLEETRALMVEYTPATEEDPDEPTS